MPTLYVGNIPKDLYEALHARARRRNRSMAAELIALLEESVPTEKELKSRQAFLRRVCRLRATKTLRSGSSSTTADLQNQDRLR
jgi:plasmid stability protein